MGEFGHELTQLREQIAGRIAQCSQLLQNQFNQFVSLLSLFRQLCLDTYEENHTTAQTMSQEGKEFAQQQQAALHKGLDSVFEATVQNRSMLRDAHTTLEGHTRESISSHKDFLAENASLTLAMDSCTRELSSWTAESSRLQLDLLQKARQGYMDQMKASKQHFLQQIETIYDRHVQQQMDTFEESFQSLQQAAVQTHEQDTAFQKVTMDTLARLAHQQKEQQGLQDHTSQFVTQSAHDLESILTSSTETETNINERLVTLLPQFSSLLAREWAQWTRAREEKHAEHMDSVDAEQQAFQSDFQACQQAIQRSYKRHYQPLMDNFDDTLQNNVLAKQIGFSERKIHDYTQSQAQQSLSLGAYLTKALQSWPTTGAPAMYVDDGAETESEDEESEGAYIRAVPVCDSENQSPNLVKKISSPRVTTLKRRSSTHRKATTPSTKRRRTAK